jgi:hypothetical protein
MDIIDIETEKPPTREEAAQYYQAFEVYKPKAPKSGVLGMSQQEINDLYAVRRMLKALAEKDTGKPHSLAARLTCHDLGLAFIVFHELEKASAELDGEIDNCFPEETT